MKRRDFIKQASALGGLPFGLLDIGSPIANAAEPTVFPLGCGMEPEGLRISIVGAGGLGVRLVARLAERPPAGTAGRVQINYFGVDTDVRSLDGLKVGQVQPVALSVGAGGSCVRPSTARGIAREHYEHLFDGYRPDDRGLALLDAHMIIIAAGFGRGVGTGLSQEIARQARYAGIFTAAFITRPLSFEGQPEALTADINRLALGADTVITVTHDESDPDALANDVLTKCENDLVTRVQSLLTVLLDNDVRLHHAFDLEDVRSIFHGTGIASYGVGYGSSSSASDCSARMAVRNAIQSLDCNGEAGDMMIIFSGRTDTLCTTHYWNGLNELRSLLGTKLVHVSNGRYDDTMPAGQIGVEIWIPGGGRA